jgi:uncharacterized protein (DUF433 family)
MLPIEGYVHLARDATHRAGRARIASHGLVVSGIVQMYRSGMSAEQISKWYDDLPVGAVFSALAYAADHPEEIDTEIAEELRSENEGRKAQALHPKLKAALERGTVLP